MTNIRYDQDCSYCNARCSYFPQLPFAEYALKHIFAKHSLSSKQDWVLLCTIEVILGYHVLFNCHKESWDPQQSWWFSEYWNAYKKLSVTLRNWEFSGCGTRRNIYLTSKTTWKCIRCQLNMRIHGGGLFISLTGTSQPPQGSATT